MPDISLRFHKDMLVFSTPLTAALERQGIDVQRDAEFTLLFELDSVQEALRLEKIAGAQCLVTSTASITPARLARQGMEERAADIVDAALSVVRAAEPQHVLVEVGPCGLPLDGSSKASLNENRDQYARATRLFAGEELDAFFLNGFRTCDDLKCALMGMRQATDCPVFASVDVLADGTLASGRGTLEEAFAVMGEYGAQAVGFATSAPLEEAVALAERAAACSDLPLLVQLEVRERKPRQGRPTPENPYYCPDVLVEAATRLRAAGAQFLRAVGQATPAYTGALAAATMGFDVAVAPQAEAEAVAEESLEDAIAALRAEVAAALSGRLVAADAAPDGEAVTETDAAFDAYADADAEQEA